MKDILQLVDDTTVSTVSLGEANGSDAMKQLREGLAHLDTLSLTSPTARLWLQFNDMIDILLKSIKAERTGNWLLGLEAVKEMLPYFSASGHLHYLKSAYLYHQNMLQLKQTNLHIYQQFVE